MRRTLSTAITLLLVAAAAHAQESPDAAELNRLLNEFLAGAARNDAATHDRFWADDLVYTGSTGRRVGKADIMRDVRGAPPPKPGDPSITYGAEDVRVRLYGDAAVVAFRLVATTARGGKSEVARYLNTGTFLKRGGRWQVVSWQATRAGRVEDEVKEEVLAAEAAFRQAATGSDAAALEALTDEGFVWTRVGGEPLTRRQLLAAAGAGQLRAASLKVQDVKVELYGDAAVVRGVVLPASSVAGFVPAPVPYTMMLVNRGGWKAVALTSTP